MFRPRRDVECFFKRSPAGTSRNGREEMELPLTIEAGRNQVVSPRSARGMADALRRDRGNSNRAGGEPIQI